MIRQAYFAVIAAISIPGIALAQGPQAKPVAPSALAVPATSTNYADIADLVTIAPLIVDAQFRRLTKVPATQAVGVPPHLQRMLVEADVLALLRGTDGIAPRVRFLLDVPKDAKGKLPKLGKKRFFLLGSKATGLPGTIRLARPDALIEWSAGNDAMVRAITMEAVKLDAPRPVTGIASAFHSSGTVIGEGETQIFLKTDRDQPISISILSRPGQAKSWAVSTTEVIDESAGAPARNTLLWYRLACSLPRSLDRGLIEVSEESDATQAQADYRFVIDALGKCDRTRPLP